MLKTVTKKIYCGCGSFVKSSTLAARTTYMSALTKAYDVTPGEDIIHRSSEVVDVALIVTKWCAIKY